MKNFTYYQPKSVEAAVGLLEEERGKVELLAGGTDLMDLMKEYVAQPDRVVSLSGVPGQEVNNITRGIAHDAAKRDAPGVIGASRGGELIDRGALAIQVESPVGIGKDIGHVAYVARGILDRDIEGDLRLIKERTGTDHATIEAAGAPNGE